jgi:hypothetical protein
VEKLRELKLASIEDRRIEADMALTHKILCDSEQGYSDQWFKMANSRRTTRLTAGARNLLHQRGQHEYRRRIFQQQRNRLPEPVKAADTAAAFKRRYRQHIESRVARTVA